jgi:glycosyltransferase involved in cell wall biosynthesis
MADGYAWMKDKASFSRRFSGILKTATETVVMTKNGPDRQFMANNDVSAVYIPNATALPEITGNFRNKYGISEDCFLVLHVANLYWQKNHLGLIDTLINLPESWKLVMLGNPTGEPECAKAVKAKLKQRSDILFISGLNRVDVSAAMETADVVVLSSFSEGSPNTILEAMSHKKPWLATPECGAANDNAGGIICCLPEFIEYLSVLQKSPDLRSQLGEIGYRHWRECFSWQPVINSWLELIETGNLSYSLATPLQIDSEMTRLRELIAARIISLKSVNRDVL